MDVNQDGVVTLDEFLECCHKDDSISRSMAVFDTAFWPETNTTGKRNNQSKKNKKPPVMKLNHQNEKNNVHYQKENGGANQNRNNNILVQMRPSTAESENASMPDSPSLVRVKTWYTVTVAKQGVSC